MAVLLGWIRGAGLRAGVALAPDTPLPVGVRECAMEMSTTREGWALLPLPIRHIPAGIRQHCRAYVHVPTSLILGRPPPRPPRPSSRQDSLVSLAARGGVDVVLLLAVAPGWGGQAFRPAVLDKVRQLRQAAGPELRIQVSGDLGGGGWLVGWHWWGGGGAGSGLLIGAQRRRTGHSHWGSNQCCGHCVPPDARAGGVFPPHVPTNARPHGRPG